MALADAPDFTPAFDDLQDHLPDWYAAVQNPSSEMGLMLQAVADWMDQVSVLWETPYLNQVLTTADADGLLHNFAFAWGLQNEQLPTVLPQLVAYIQALASSDGSLISMIQILTSLVDSEANITGGSITTFPTGGAGLEFPADGSGLILYEFTPGNAPSTELGLVFPADGSGLIFPTFPSSLPSDNVIVQDGTTPIGAGPGLIFAANQFVDVIPNFTTLTLTVKVCNWLAFDRGAFARAVDRFQDASWYPTQIIEVPSL